MAHLKFIKVEGEPFTECREGAIYLYKTPDGEVFTSKQSAYKYLWELGKK